MDSTDLGIGYGSKLKNPRHIHLCFVLHSSSPGLKWACLFSQKPGWLAPEIIASILKIETPPQTTKFFFLPLRGLTPRVKSGEAIPPQLSCSTTKSTRPQLITYIWMSNIYSTESLLRHFQLWVIFFKIKRLNDTN